MHPENLVELGNIELHWLLCCYMHAQMGRQTVSKEGGEKWDGAGMTGKANGSMLLDFIAKM